MKTKKIRYDIYNDIIEKYPSLKVMMIDGHKGFGYIKLDELLKVANELGVYNA